MYTKQQILFDFYQQSTNKLYQQALPVKHKLQTQILDLLHYLLKSTTTLLSAGSLLTEIN